MKPVAPVTVTRASRVAKRVLLARHSDGRNPLAGFCEASQLEGNAPSFPYLSVRYSVSFHFAASTFQQTSTLADFLVTLSSSTTVMPRVSSS